MRNRNDVVNLCEHGKILGSAEAEEAVVKEIKNQLMSNSIGIPTLQYFRKVMCPSVDSKLLALYEIIMRNLGVEGWQNVSPEVRIVQATLFDGTMFMYDANLDGYWSVACRPYSVSATLLGKKVVEANLKGFSIATIPHIRRKGSELVLEPTLKGILDPHFNPRILDPRESEARVLYIDEVKSDGDAEKVCTLIPYIFIEKFVDMMLDTLNKGKLVKVVSAGKEHFITKNSDLFDYCGYGAEDDELLNGTKFYVQDGYFYAPEIVGSSQGLTVKLVKIGIFDISAVSLADIRDIKA